VQNTSVSMTTAHPTHRSTTASKTARGRVRVIDRVESRDGENRCTAPCVQHDFRSHEPFLALKYSTDGSRCRIAQLQVFAIRSSI
jgi:hypothetical protein